MAGWVVSPRRLAQGRLTSSVSSATIAPGMSAYQSTGSIPAWKPIWLPKDMFITAWARPCSTAQAALTLPAWCRS